MSAGTKSPSVTIKLKADVDEFVKSTRAQINKIKNLGLDTAFSEQILDVDRQLTKLSTDIANVNNTLKHNQGDPKVLNGIIDQINEVTNRVDVLEKAFAEAKDTINSTAAKSQLGHLFEKLNGDLTKTPELIQKVVDALKELESYRKAVQTPGQVSGNIEKPKKNSNVDVDSASNKEKLEQLKAEKKAAKELLDLFDKVGEKPLSAFGKGKNDERLAYFEDGISKIQEYAKEYNQLQDELNTTDNENETTRKLIETAHKILNVYNALEDAENQFIIKNKKNIANLGLIEGTEQTFLDFKNLINADLGDIEDGVEDTINTLTKEINTLQDAVDIASKKVSKKNSNQTGEKNKPTSVQDVPDKVNIPVQMSEEAAQKFMQDVRNLVNLTQTQINADGGLKIDLDFKTDWGKRQEKEAVKKLKAQLDTLDGRTKEAKELKKITEEVEKAFSGRIELKFTQNFAGGDPKKPDPKSVAGKIIAQMKEISDLAGNIPIHIKPNLTEAGQQEIIDDIQAAIDEMGKNIKLVIPAANVEGLSEQVLEKTKPKSQQSLQANYDISKYDITQIEYYEKAKTGLTALNNALKTYEQLKAKIVSGKSLTDKQSQKLDEIVRKFPMIVDYYEQINKPNADLNLEQHKLTDAWEDVQKALAKNNQSVVQIGDSTEKVVEETEELLRLFTKVQNAYQLLSKQEGGLSTVAKGWQEYVSKGGTRSIEEITKDADEIAVLTKGLKENTAAKEQNSKASKSTKQKDIAQMHGQEAENLSKAASGYKEYVNAVDNANTHVGDFVTTLQNEIETLKTVKDVAKNTGSSVEQSVQSSLPSSDSSEIKIPNNATQTLENAEKVADRFFSKIDKFGRVNENLVKTVEPAVKAMEDEAPKVSKMSEAFGQAASNAQNFVDALEKIPEKLQKKAMDKLAAEELEKAAKDEPTIKHNGLKAFSDKRTKEYKDMMRQARAYEKHLGKIVTISRSVVADKEIFNVIGANGNSVQLARDTEGGWTKATEVLENHKEELAKTLKLQKSFISERDKLNKVRADKYVGQSAAAIKKYQEDISKVDLFSQSDESLDELITKMKYFQQDVIKPENTIAAGQKALNALRQRFNKLDADGLGKDLERSLEAAKKRIGDFDLTQNSRKRLDTFLQEMEVRYSKLSKNISEKRSEITATENELKSSRKKFQTQTNNLNKIDSKEYIGEAARAIESLKKEVAKVDITKATSEKLDALRGKIVDTLGTYKIEAYKIEKVQASLKSSFDQFENLEIRTDAPDEIYAKVREVTEQISKFDYSKASKKSITDFKNYLDKAYQEIQTATKSYNSEMDALEKQREKDAIDNAKRQAKAKYQEIEEEYKEQQRLQKKESSKLAKSQASFTKQRDKLNNIDPNRYVSDVATVIRQLQDEANAVDIESAPKEQLDDLITIIRNVVAEYDKAANVIAKKPIKLDIHKLRDDYSKLDYQAYGEQARNALLAVQKELESVDLTKATREDLEKLQQTAKDTYKVFSKTLYQYADSKRITGIYTKIATFYGDNTAMPKDAKREFEQMMKALQSGAKLTNEELDRMIEHFNVLSGKIKETGQGGNSLWTSIRKQFQSSIASFAATYVSLQDIVRYVHQAGQEVVKLDSALTELRKVSDASTSRLQESFKESAKTAQELGQNIQHVINVTADWTRLGYDIGDAEELARITTMFTTVGDNMSADDASSYLISTLQGFQLAADDAESVIDKYNEVANNFAIDTRGIGEALKRSAASFNAAHTNLSESIALITATNEVLQDPESVGTLWKTMSARLRGAKTELKDLGEEEDAFTKSTSKLRDMVKGMTGFDIMKDKDTFKSIYEIMIGIGEQWDKLTDVEQASLGEALAGKRNANGLYAVLGNIDNLKEAYKDAEKSAGSAAKEQENYSKSIQYSIDKVKASLEELAYDFINSDLLKRGAEFLNDVIQKVDKLVKHSKELLPLLTTVGIGAGFVKFTSTIKTLSDVMNKYVVDSKAAFALMQEGTPILANLTQGAYGLTTGIAGATKASLAFVATPVGAVITGVALAAGIAVGAIQLYRKQLEEMRQQALETAQSFDEQTSSLEDATDKYQELHASLSDSNITEEEAYGIKEQLAELQSELNEQYANEHERLNLVNGDYREQLGLLKDISEQEAHQHVVDNAKGYEDAQKTLHKNISDGVSVLPGFKADPSDANQAKLMNFIHNYGNGIDGQFDGMAKMELTFDIDAENAKEVIDQFRLDLDSYAKSNNIDIEDFLGSIKDWEDENIDTEAIDNAKAIADAYTRAQLIWNDGNGSLVETYDEATQAVQEYNEALASGEGIEQANQHIENLKKEISDLDTDENIRNVLNNIFNDIDEESSQVHEVELKLKPSIDKSNSIVNEFQQRIASDKADLEKLGYDITDTMFGNVDLSKDRVIEWTEDNLNKFKDALLSSHLSGKESAEEIEHIWQEVKEHYQGSISTIDAYSTEVNGIPIAVTPMFRNPKTGEMEYLSDDVINNYLKTTVANAHGDYSKILEIDAPKNGGMGIIAGLGEDAESISQVMHYLGPDGSIIDGMRELKAAQQDLAEDDSVIQYTQKLQGLRDVDVLHGFDGLTEQQKSAFQELMNYCGLTEGQEKILVKTLTQLGVLAGKTAKKINTAAQETASDIVTANQEITTNLKPQFEALGKAYNDIFHGDKGFSLDVVDEDMINSIVQSFTVLGKNLKVPFDEGQEAVNEFVNVITSAETKSKSLKEQQEITQTAFNNLASAYFNSADGLKNLNKETADSIEQQLKQLGIVNSKEIVQYYRDLQQAEEAAAAESIELTNATADQIEALCQEANIAPKTAQALLVLALAKQRDAGINFSETGNINQIMALAKAAQIGGKFLTMLAKAKSLQTSIDNGDAGPYAEAELAALQKQIDSYDLEAEIEVKFDYTGLGKASSKAGKDAADKYVKAYEEELKKLDEMKSSGLISETEYLEKLKALIDKYFKDRAKYAEKYALEIQKYFEKVKQHYDSVISGVVTLFQHKIDALNKAKDKAIKAINDEKDAALKALNDEKKAFEEAHKAKIDAIEDEIDKYNAQIKVYQKQQKALQKLIKQKQREIKAIEKANKVKEKEKKAEEKFIKEQQKIIKANQKEIDQRNKKIEPLQEQIDALNKVNDARKEAIELQKAEYELERQKNQRTKLVYTGEQGQMRYERDEVGVRDAQDALDDKKNQAKVNAIQKKIDALQDEIKSYEKIIEQYQEIIDQHQEIIDGIDEYLESQQELIDSINEEIELLNEEVERYDDLIEPLQEHIDLLNEQKEALQKAYDKEHELMEKRIEETEEMYDKMLKDAEKYWDALIEKLEQTKSKWDELAQVEEVAKAWSLVSEEMGKLGYTVEDVLNDTPGAFEAFKSAYIDALNNMNNGNENWKKGVQYATSEAEKNYKSVQDAAKLGASGVDELATATSGLSSAAQNIDNLASSLNATSNETSELKEKSNGLAENFGKLGDQSAKVGELTTALGEVCTKIEEKTAAFENEDARVSAAIDDEVKELRILYSQLELVIGRLANMRDSIDLHTLVQQFNMLSGAVENVGKALRGGDSGVSITDSINNLSTQTDLSTLQEQFDTLKGTIEKTVEAIVGGGETKNSFVDSLTTLKQTADETIGQAADETEGTMIGDLNQFGLAAETVSTEKLGSKESAADDGTLSGALVSLHEQTDAHIGVKSGSDGENVIGDFHQLGVEVDDVTQNHIGTEDNAETLVGSIKATSDETTKEIAGTATKDFDTLKSKIDEANTTVGDLKQSIDDLVGGSPYKVTIQIETEGEIPSIPSMFKLGKGQYTGTATTGQAHFEGTANLQGNWGVQQGGKSLVGELGQELIVRNGRFFTVGDNGAEFVNLQPGDVIFNHLQTKQLLDKKNLVMPGNMRGKAFASGSAFSAISKSSPISGLQSKVQSVIGQIIPTITTLTQAVEKNTTMLQKHFDHTSRKSSANQPNVTINNPQFTVSGVTGEEVVKKIEHEFEGLMLTAYQKSMK